MVYQFKKVETRNVRSEDRITITTSNSIGFPRKFFQDNKIFDFKYVVLYFDTENKALGILFSNDENEKFKFKIIKNNKGYGGSAVVSSFFKSYNLDPKIYHNRYSWEIVNKEGVGNLYVINLKERANST